MLTDYKKCFDIVIEKDCFHLIETSQKYPKKPISALKKIATILKKNLSYSDEMKDSYSKLNREALQLVLQKKAFRIQKKYIPKKYSEEKKQKAIGLYKKIQDLASPCKILPLPNELIQKILDYLKLRELPAVAGINHAGKTHANIAILKRARDFNFTGVKTYLAKKYLKHIFFDIKRFHQAGLLPNSEEMDPEKALNHLRYLNEKDVFSLCAKREFYKRQFQLLRIFFIEKHENTEKAPSPKMDKDAAQALFLAILHKESRILNMLLSYGANPNIQGKFGRTPLLMAAKNVNKDAVRILLKHQADPNLMSKDRKTPLYHAVCKSNKTLTKMLIKHKANLNIADKEGYTPLVINTSHPKITQFLLQHGAEINQQTNMGDSALYYAAKKGQTETLKILLEHGANPNIRTNTQKTPIEFAKNRDIYALLIKRGATPPH